MGTAIVYAMAKLGFRVFGVDSDPNAADNMPDDMELNCDFIYAPKTQDMFEWILQARKPDIVISSLPYHQTEEVGMWCVDNGVRYCDLGGRVSVSANINEYAGRVGAEHSQTKPVFTDLGLAPGWANILAEQGRKATRGAKSIEMYVGGLPRMFKERDPLKYEATWSIDGLINEYRDNCLILKHGEIQEVKGMDGYEVVDFLGSKLEAFYTSGGAAHTIETMKKAGVQDCSYKTLRYSGHRDVIKFLMEDCELEEEVLKNIFEKGCRPTASGDRVLIYVKAKNGLLEWKKYVEVLSDSKFSAMQKATAFPIACVASIMAEGKLEGDKDQHRDYWTKYPTALTYADVPYEELRKRLDRLGIENNLSYLEL